MDSLPIAPSCALDEPGLRLQLERYRRAGRGASLVERNLRRLVVQLEPHVDVALVDAALAIERECCPFLTLDWQASTRRLTVSTGEREHESALDGIAFALGLVEDAERAASN
jgi:hypothetical protein